MGPLQHRWIGLSGAVPTPEDFPDWEWNDLDVRLTVTKVVERVLALGGNIVHGSHPTFVPLIEAAALGANTSEGPRVHILVAELPMFFPTPEKFKDYYRRHERYAKVEPLNMGGDLDKTLAQLRERLIQTAEALVCVGGRAIGKGVQKIAGVGAEIRAAMTKRPPLPLYLAGAPGGFTRFLVENQIVTRKDLEPNTLDDSENEFLALRADPWQATELIIRGLTRYFERHPRAK